MHKPVDPSISVPKSASLVLAMWILGMMLGKEAMDILTALILIHSVNRLKTKTIGRRVADNHTITAEDARSLAKLFCT